MVNNLVILGSTGSIGTQALELIEPLEKNIDKKINIIALTANKNYELLIKQAKKFKPKYVVLTDKKAYNKSMEELSSDGIEVLFGEDALSKVASLDEADMVLNSLVGIVGLKPTVSAINAGKDVSLANKETLVAGGELVMHLAKEKGINLLPVDSEHSAIFQSLRGERRVDLNKIILTASGGPFFGYTKEQLKAVTKKDALKHPNWNMGAKITIDSATLMNKGLELIEAMHLFSVKPEDIEIVVNRESVLHSAVEYVDGSIIGQMGTPTMKIPIQFALTYPVRMKSDVKHLSFTDIGTLTFFKPDIETFTCLETAIKAAKAGGIMPATVNGANEQAVALFLDDKIPFYMIGEYVKAAFENTEFKTYSSVSEVLEADKSARKLVLDLLKSKNFIWIILIKRNGCDLS